MSRRKAVVLLPMMLAVCGLSAELSVFGQMPAAANAAPADPAATNNATDARTDSTTSGQPAYLKYLERKAQEHLDRSAAEEPEVPTATARYRTGPIDRVAYGEYVEATEMSGTIEADSVSLTRPVIPRVVVTDRDALAYLFQCCAYNEVAIDSMEFVEIYDFSRSGFSNGDLMVVHPSGNSYILQGLSTEFMANAATWKQAGHLEYKTYHRETRYMDSLVDELSPPETYDWNIPEPDLNRELEVKMALRAIWGSVHQAIVQQYGLSPMQMHFARNDTTTSIELWGYEPDSLQFNYLNNNEGVARNDLLTVSVRDTMIESYRNYVDMIVIQDSRRDTLYTRAADPTTEKADQKTGTDAF